MHTKVHIDRDPRWLCAHAATVSVCSGERRGLDCSTSMIAFPPRPPCLPCLPAASRHSWRRSATQRSSRAPAPTQRCRLLVSCRSSKVPPPPGPCTTAASRPSSADTLVTRAQLRTPGFLLLPPRHHLTRCGLPARMGAPYSMSPCPLSHSDILWPSPSRRCPFHLRTPLPALPWRSRGGPARPRCKQCSVGGRAAALTTRRPLLPRLRRQPRYASASMQAWNRSAKARMLKTQLICRTRPLSYPRGRSAWPFPFPAAPGRSR